MVSHELQAYSRGGTLKVAGSHSELHLQLLRGRRAPYRKDKQRKLEVDTARCHWTSFFLLSLIGLSTHLSWPAPSSSLDITISSP